MIGRREGRLDLEVMGSAPGRVSPPRRTPLIPSSDGRVKDGGGFDGAEQHDGFQPGAPVSGAGILGKVTLVSGRSCRQPAGEANPHSRPR